jgi:D-glycero-D-manno-heptose 1,7-bisphosphate phosphatase
MKELKKSLKSFNVGKDWTLFLDRDGVINRKIEGDYVKNWSQFEFIEGVIEGLRILRQIFGRIIIVTNQRGIGRGFMTEEDLKNIHDNMGRILKENGIIIDGIYYCPHDYEKEICNCRKPKPGLAYKAKADFPEIDFQRSFMVGDSLSDMEFGKALGMTTVFIVRSSDAENPDGLVDFVFNSLLQLGIQLKESCNII